MAAWILQDHNLAEQARVALDKHLFEHGCQAADDRKVLCSRLDWLGHLSSIITPRELKSVSAWLDAERRAVGMRQS